MLSNFPNGVSSFGIPVFGSGGLMSQGNAWFVKPHTGNDGNSGTSPDQAFKTLSTALSAATANQNDTIYFFAESNTAANTTDYQSATLDWNKDLVHLVGVCAPTEFSQRSRIAQLSTATGVSPLFKISANGCIIMNISIFQGVADATSLICTEVTGQRNYFYNCHFAGIGNATMVTAGAMSLKLNGAAENVFERCTVGLDTISRDQNCTELNCVSSATRNSFIDCWIDSYISNAGFAGVTIGTNGIDRSLTFKKCKFTSKSTNKAVTQTSVFSIPAISQGDIILEGSMAFSDGGAVDWDSNNRGIIWNNTSSAAALAAGGIATNQ